MAVQNFNAPTITRQGAYVVFWETMLTGNTGTPFECGSHADRSVQLSGTWGGSTAVFQGSNDGVTWFTLTDPQGNAITATTDKLEQIEEMTRFVRPSVSGGAGADLDIIMLARGDN